jgi:2-oxo-4-hydroxy-4-carboxy--5-ureidoimidazoline (OHCU) decarboxylase
MTSLVGISELNTLPCREFTRALQPLLEAAGPLGQPLCARRPYASYSALLDEAAVLAVDLPREQQIELVNAHPRVGADPAMVSELSYREQGYAAEEPHELGGVYEQLRELNRQYEERFGFRFVVYVNRRPKSAIVDVLRQRLSGSPDEELRTALHDMLEIARDRLRTLS